MAGSYNHITVVGNLTRDVEVRYTDGGAKLVAKFCVAVNRKSKSGDETMFIDVVAWERLGEICSQYLSKGMATLISGRLTIRNYDDREGNKRKAVEIVASEMQILESKRDRDGGGERATGYEGASSRQSSDSLNADIYDEIPFAEDPREYRHALYSL